MRLKDKISILTRSFQNKRTAVKNDDLEFNNQIIEISPNQGQIYPGRSVEISVIYRPEKIGHFEKTFFCDVQGRETRLPLVVRGFGLGPQLDFNYDSIDIGKIFVTSHHTYEVVLRNRGEIDAKFSLSSPNYIKRLEIENVKELTWQSSFVNVESLCKGNDMVKYLMYELKK